MAYVTAMVAAVPTANRDAYIEMSNRCWPLFKKYGATGGKDCWGNDVPDGEVTSFPLAVKKADDETVCFSFIEWPDKATADACFAEMDKDPEWTAVFADGMPMDGKRMIWGNFDTVAQM